MKYKKAQEKLHARRMDWDKGCQGKEGRSLDSKPQSRYKSGGYTRPGAIKRD